MDPEVFIFIAFEAFAVLGVVLLGWTLLHFAAPRHDDELPH